MRTPNILSLFEIEEWDHPIFGWYISVDDELAWAFDSELDQLTEALSNHPDVTQAHREDREVILVGGDITRAALTAFIVEWWDENAT